MVEETGGRELLVAGLAEEVGLLLGSETRRRGIATEIRRLGQPAAAAAVVDVLAETLVGRGAEDPASFKAA